MRGYLFNMFASFFPTFEAMALGVPAHSVDALEGGAARDARRKPDCWKRDARRAPVPIRNEE